MGTERFHVGSPSAKKRGTDVLIHDMEFTTLASNDTTTSQASDFSDDQNEPYFAVNTLYTVLKNLILVFGLIGNALVIVVMSRFERMSTSVYLSVLAVFDSIVLLAGESLFITSSLEQSLVSLDVALFVCLFVCVCVLYYEYVCACVRACLLCSHVHNGVHGLKFVPDFCLLVLVVYHFFIRFCG